MISPPHHPKRGAHLQINREPVYGKDDLIVSEAPRPCEKCNQQKVHFLKLHVRPSNHYVYKCFSQSGHGPQNPAFFRVPPDVGLAPKCCLWDLPLDPPALSTPPDASPRRPLPWGQTHIWGLSIFAGCVFRTVGAFPMTGKRIGWVFFTYGLVFFSYGCSWLLTVNWLGFLLTVDIRFQPSGTEFRADPACTRGGRCSPLSVECL